MEPKKLWNRNYILMLQGTVISRFGDILYSIAIGYYVLEVTGSSAWMGIFTSISMFVQMFLSPVCGAFVDRLNRKNIIVYMDLIRGIVMLGIGWLVIQNNLTIPILMAITLVIALCGVFFTPASSTVLIDIVPKSDLVQAQSINGALYNVLDLISKGISGFLLVFLGIGPMIIFNGISFVISAFTEYFVHVPKTIKQGTKITIKTIGFDLWDGLKSIIQTSGLNVLFCSALFINLFSAGLGSLLLVMTNEKGFTIEQYGILMSAISAGALLGAVLVGGIKIPNKMRPFVMLFGFLLSGGAMILGLLSSEFIWVCIFFFLGDFLNVAGNMILNASMMLVIPIDKRSTVLGFIISSSMGGIALSTVIYGFLAETFSISMLGIFGTILSGIVMVFVLGSKKVLKVVEESGEAESV